ncbi:MAG: hypothetical protein JSV88_06735 [Candidatus Aminicenantes bacterium]|nr:MAG: hypothetical protein JSV88_06735 [Candidatus Aminicenantes bacterium]
MSEGYGSRIYVQKRRRFNPWPYIIVMVVLVGSWFLFNSLNEGRSPSAPLPGEPKKHVETLPDDSFQSMAEKESDREEIPLVEQAPEPSENTGKTPPATNHPRLSKAHEHYMKREYKRALPLYKKLAGSNQEALVYAGLCCYWLKDYDNAHYYLQQAVDNDKRDFLARKFMALTCYKMDELTDSLIHTEAGLALLGDAELLALYNKLQREKRVMKEYSDTKKVYFKVQFSKSEHINIKETVLDILQEARRTIGSEINFYPPNPITVILYNEKGFFDVTRAPGWAGGLYDGKIRLPIKGVEGQEAKLKRILFHEYTHALVHAITPRCPVWINEGLAEYFSEDEELLEIGKKYGQLIPLRLLERGFPSGNPRLVAVAYLQSYTAVTYLIDKHGLFRLKELLEALGKGENLNRAFRNIFYDTYDHFVKNWGRD